MSINEQQGRKTLHKITASATNGPFSGWKGSSDPPNSPSWLDLIRDIGTSTPVVTGDLGSNDIKISITASALSITRSNG